jgi:hypothetical protein
MSNSADNAAAQSEELPPELPKQSDVAPDCAGVLMEKLRQLFDLGAAANPPARVLAILEGRRPFQAGIAPRAGLAELCGYQSELEFFEESQPVATASPRSWFATPDKVHGGWILWCDEHDRAA